VNPKWQEMKEHRMRTGIGGLDERLGEGLPRGSLVLVLSNSGTALRMFCQRVPYNLARFSFVFVVEAYGGPAGI